MKSKILVLMVLAAFSFLSIFGGCGGGGGGSRDHDDDDGNGGLRYTGETAPAEIDQDNAVDIAAGAFAGGKTGTLQYATGLPVDNFRYYKVPQILGDAAGSIDLSPYLHNLSSNADAVYTETGTVEGTCGGSFDYTVTKNDVSGEFEGTFSFFWYCDHCVAIDGDVDFEGRADPDSGDIITITFWFDYLSDDTMTMDGEVSMDFSDDPIVCTLDALFKDEITGKVFWAQNYSLNLYAGLVGGISKVEIFGTFYHPDYGYVTVSTEEPFYLFTVLRIEFDEWPRSGYLLMNGANDTNASLTAIDPTCIDCEEPVWRCKISADTDGNGSYDWNSGELNWSKPAIDPENWMRDLGDHIKTVKIKNVVLPGTHDSYTNTECWHPEEIQCWSEAMLRAQTFGPDQQLKDGIRYFDLRYQWQKKGSNELGEKNLRIWHGECHTCNFSIQWTMEMVKAFVESHPKEIIILDLSHWSFMNEERHRAAAKYIVQELETHLVPWDIGKKFHQEPINFGSPDITVQQLWKKGKNVIVIYHPDPKFLEDGTYDIHSDPDFADGRYFWGGEFTAQSIIVSQWYKTKEDFILAKSMKAALNCRSEINGDFACVEPDAYDKLFVLQAQRTPKLSDAGGPGIRGLAQVTNPKVILWLQYWTTYGNLYPSLTPPNISPQVARENLNIVQVDFYEFGGKDIHNSCRNKSFVETIVELNLNRAPLFE